MPVKKVCPLCGREAEVLTDLSRTVVWAYHDANPPQRALCPSSTMPLAVHGPLPEITNPAVEDVSKVEVLFAFIAEDADGEEGVAAVMGADGLMPLLGADLDRMGSLIPYAQVVANVRKKPVRLVLFSQPTVLDTIEPE